MWSKRDIEIKAKLLFGLYATLLLVIFINPTTGKQILRDPSNKFKSKVSQGRNPEEGKFAKLNPDPRTLEQIYRSAINEIGNESLIIYAGGDDPHQLDIYKIAFESDFPLLKIEIIVDLSKNHDRRIDYQLATNSIQCDVAQLQTLQDFPRWKAQGALLQYKPIDWHKIHNEFKDPEGFYAGILIYFFSNNINSKLLPDPSKWPREARDYLRPEFKNKLIMTYPNDDDAVLFLFKLITDKYGFAYFDHLIAQNVTWVRGTQTALDRVTTGESVATMTAYNSLLPVRGKPIFLLPKNDPFVIWAQTAAILKDAPHPEAAKLYLSWMVSKRRQSDKSSFSVRTGVGPPPGYLRPWEYSNGCPTCFRDFMLDRLSVEKCKRRITKILGPPVGPNPNGYLGPRPVVALA